MKLRKKNNYTVIMLGDITDTAGKNAVVKYLPDIIIRYDPSLIIANAENSAGGHGLDWSSFQLLMDNNINVITLGNHAKAHSDVFEIMQQHKNVIAPANMLFNGDYHNGYYVHHDDDICLGVINLIGNSNMNVFSDNVFKKADKLINVLKDRCNAIFVDFHAEDLEEKLIMANYLSGRITALCGTHLHVPTADARIINNYTGYQTDIGMCGNYNWNNKNRINYVTRKFLSHSEYKLYDRTEDATLCAVAINFNPYSGKCLCIKSIVMSELLNKVD